jgi:phosphoglycerol transferase MdoB-like AlkP superfamily enzyme
MSPSRTRVARILGTVLILLSVAFNKWALSALLHRQTDFSSTTQIDIAAAEAAMLAIGILCLTPNTASALRVFIARSRISRYIFAPVSSRAMWFSLAPIAIDSLIRQLTGWRGSSFHWWHPIAALAIVQGMVVSALFVTGLMAVTYRVSRSYWLPSVVGIIYAVAATVDTAFILYSKMRMSWSMVHASIGATAIYADTWIIAVGSMFILTSMVAARLTIRVDLLNKASSGLQRLALAGLILAAQPATLVSRVITAPMAATNRASIESHLDEANRFSLNPALDLLWSAVSAPSGTIVSGFTAVEAARQKPYRTADSVLVHPFTRPMKRIILVTMESMSMTLTSRYNKLLPGQLTPTIDSLPQSADNVRSVSIPTAFGLASHLCSHPNGQALQNTGHPNALPGYLAAHGWTTRFMESATLQFQSGARRFREMGYQQLYGRDEAAKDPRYAPYISDWGLCDRKVYEAAIEWLKANRDTASFLHILTADTHSPVGRLDWRGLEYPPTPDWILKSGRSQLYLQAWFRADHDLGLFLAELKNSGLLDEDTAVIITGDHTCPGGPIYTSIPGTAAEPVERLPWILISPRSMPIDLHRQTSQVATAPTIAQLAGLDPLSPWWGTSLLTKAPGTAQLAWRDRRALRVDLDGTTSVMDRDLQRLGWKIEKAR